VRAVGAKRNTREESKRQAEANGGKRRQTEANRCRKRQEEL
jgi:hypothetical protein